MTFERALALLCLAMMLTGGALRFYALGEKLYNNDEATTSMHVSGHTLAQYANETFDGRPRSLEEILAYQRPDPARGPAAVVGSLAVEDPQHPPLYYLAQYAWERVFGSSLAMHRAIAAIFGLFAIAAAIWFGTELSGRWSGLVCGALVAVSPFALLYSQEAREYSLWLLLTFASSALWLRAVRGSSARWWIAYALATALGLYTDLLYVLVACAQALALVPVARSDRRALLGALVALACAFAAASPWLALAAAASRRGGITNNAYLSVGLPFELFALKWIFNVGALFYDLDYLKPKSAVLVLPGFAAIAAAAVVLARRLRAEPHLSLVALLVLVPFVALALPDLIGHQSRSTSARYLVPMWVGVYAAVAVVLGAAATSARRTSRALAFAFVALTAVTGLGSFLVSTYHETWWIDGSVAPVGPIARAVAAVSEPVVVWKATWGANAAPGDRWDFTVVMLADELSRAGSETRGGAATFVQLPRAAPFALPHVAGTPLVLDPTTAVSSTARSASLRLAPLAGGATSASAELAAARAKADRARAARGIEAFVPSIWSVTHRSEGAP